MRDSQIVQELVELIKPIKPKKVIWFGSRVRGEGHAGSDVDLCVVLDRPIESGDRGKLLAMITRGGYDWTMDPDFFLISEQRFKEQLDDDDLFATEINKGRVVYG